MLNEDDINNSFEYVENFSKNEFLANETTLEEKMEPLFVDKCDLSIDIVNELKILINSGNLKVKDINENLVEALKKHDQAIVIDHLKKLNSKSNEQNISRNVIDLIFLLNSSHICNQSDESQINKQLNSFDSTPLDKNVEDTVNDVKQNANIIKGPDEKALQEILDRTGYSHSITSGQRKFGGPPPDWEGHPPSIGSEIYVGKIPKDIYEDKLIPLFEDCGKIWDFRLMLDPITGLSKGFAFIQFVDKESAQAAVKKLNNYEIRPGKTLKLNISIPNLRLFVGNIPKSKSKEEIFAEFSKLTEGLMNVIVYATPGEKRKNRGFCFLEYQTHLAASVAKKRLASASSCGNGGPTNKLRVWNCDIIVEWADVQDEPNEEIMAKVKVLYVRNLALSVTEPDLREAFEKWGSVEHVKKLKDYAFVHFTERDDALKAMQELQGCRDLPGGSGIPIEISLAKPPSEKRLQEKKFRELERKTTLAFYPASLNYAASLGFPPHQAGLMNGLNPHLGLYGSPNGINGFNPNVMALNGRYVNANGYSQFVMDNLVGGASLRGTGISYYPPKVVEADYDYDLYNGPYHPTNYYPASAGLNQTNGQILDYPQNLTANGPLQHHPGPGGPYALYPFKPPYHAIPFNGAQQQQQQTLNRPPHPQEQSSHHQAGYARSNNPNPSTYHHNGTLNRGGGSGNTRPPLLSHFHPLLPTTSQSIYANGQRRLGAQHNNNNGFAARHHKNLQETYAT